MKKVVRLLLIALGGILAIIAFGWVYTSIQLGVAGSKGVYASRNKVCWPMPRSTILPTRK